MIPPSPHESTPYNNGGSSAAQLDASALVPFDVAGGPLSEFRWPGGAPPRPAILTRGPGLDSLWHSFRRRWPLAVGVGLMLATACVLLTWWLVPARSEAVALLHVARQPKSIVASDEKGARSDQTYERYRATQGELLRSFFVLKHAISDPRISNLPLLKSESNPIGFLQRELLISSPRNSELLVLAMAAEDPDQAAKIVDAVQESYMREIVERERKERADGKDMLEKNYQKHTQELRKKRTDMRTLMDQLDVKDPEIAKVQMRLLGDQIVQMNRRVDELQNVGIGLHLQRQQKEKDMKEDKIPPVPAVLVDQAIDNNLQMRQLQGQLLQLRAQYEVYKDMIRPELWNTNPTLLRLKSSVDALEDTMEELRSELRPQYRQLVQQQLGAASGTLIGEPEEVIQQITAQLGMIDATLNITAQRRAAVQKELDNIQKKSVDIEQKQAEVTELEEITQQMGTELKLAVVELEAKPRVQVLQPAAVPERNIMLLKWVAVVASGFVGLFLGICTTSLLEFRTRRVSTSAEVAEGLGLTVMGALPSLARYSAGKGDGDGQLQNMLVESIDSIRATLMYNTSTNESPKVVMVTSATEGEGKTTVASQLAASLARAGRSTVLVDANLRSPSIHQLFDLPGGAGLCELLRSEAELDDVVQPTHLPGLSVISAGARDLQSVQSLSRESSGALFNALRAKFDFVVIDSAPVLAVADSLLIGQHVDGAIVSVLRDVSRASMVYETMERLRTVGIHLLGAVVNGERSRSRAHNLVPQLPTA